MVASKTTKTLEASDWGTQANGYRVQAASVWCGFGVVMSNPKYNKYLKSDKWKTIRAQRLALDNGECVLCAKKAQHVHHRRYPKRLGTETIKDLVSLCRECHDKHHRKQPEGHQAIPFKGAEIVGVSCNGVSPIGIISGDDSASEDKICSMIEEAGEVAHVEPLSRYIEQEPEAYVPSAEILAVIKALKARLECRT